MAEQGIFSMEFISTLERTSLTDAIASCKERIIESQASLENRCYADGVISRCKSVKDLMITTANFNLAHDGLNVLRRSTWRSYKGK